MTFWQGRALLASRISYPTAVIQLHWLKDDLSGLDKDAASPSAMYLGIRSGQTVPIPGAKGTQADPRILVLHNGSLLLYYNIFTDVWAKIKYSIGTLHNDSQTVQWTPERLLQPRQAMNDVEKNWVAMEHANKLYWLQYMSPPVVVVPELYFDNETVPSPDGRIDAATGKPLTVQTQVKKTKYTARYGIDKTNHTLAELALQVVLPWEAKLYGAIRGGTPAVLIRSRGVLLTFFHSQVCK